MERQREALKQLIEKEVFVRNTEERIVNPDGTDSDWLFDFRRILLKADALETINELFWNACKEKLPFQVGGAEVSGIPLITSLVLGLEKKGSPVNGFFVRKSRKKAGLLRMIEGKLTDEPVMLVDDMMNHGYTLQRQVEIMESLGRKVAAVFVLLRFRDAAFYSYFHERGIPLISLFELKDFQNSLGLQNQVRTEQKPVPMPFSPQWYWKAEKPDYFQVVPKSAPALNDSNVYFGTDNGSFWALRQSDGTTVWKYDIAFGSKKRKAFSSPVLHGGWVYVGAHDGNFYALDAETGKRKWVFMEADWIGSTPCVAPEANLIFVALEFGLWSKRSSLVALDAGTGEKKWECGLTRAPYASPAYLQKFGIVICGYDEQTVAGMDARNGNILWTYKADGDIRGSFGVDETQRILCFGEFNGGICFIDPKKGTFLRKTTVDAGIWSTPLVHNERVYVTSLDKCIYCLDLKTGAILWKFATNGRIFASPELIDDKIYVGSNDGRLYEINAHDGKNTAIFQGTERITDKIAYNPLTKKFFLASYANELYCLERSSG